MITLSDAIEKPLLDDRSYKFVQLDNGINVLLIHDPTTDLAAAALDVHVGAYKDNEFATSGLAHFCEHLLFMGTEKFPNENEYSSYLAKHGGHSNAYTSFEHTNYYFELNSQFLSGALDRFSQFFINPLFDENCKDREINAVDSENKKNLQNDHWRFYQLEKSLSNPLHPFNHFSTGNLKTLNKPEIRDILLDFYTKNYSSNLMSLTILGKESLSELATMAQEFFTPVKNKHLPLPNHQPKLLTDKELGKYIKAKSIMDLNKLEINFFLDHDEDHNWKYLPSNYYSHLFGHESKGSVYYYLNEKGYINGLSSGSSRICKNSSMFIVEVELTDKGLENYKEIIVNVFQYLKLLKDTPINKYVFEEIKQINNINFKFKQKTNAASTVSKLSNSLYKFNSIMPPHSILNHQTLIEFNEVEIKKYGDYLNLDNFRYSLTSKKFDNLPLTEKWYGTNYDYGLIDQDLLNDLKNCNLNEKFFFPRPNEFIPENFKIFGEKAKSPLKNPYLIKNSNKFQIWFKIDDQFEVPKLSISLFLHLPNSNKDIVTTILTQLYCELFEDELNDISYYASLVNLSFSINQWRDGILIKLNGYNDKMMILLKEILSKLNDFKPQEFKFNIIKNKLLQDFKNFDFEVPYYQVNNNFLTLINEKTYLTRDKISFLQKITFFELGEFIPKLFSTIFVESLIIGNINIDELRKIANIFEKNFSKIPTINDSIDEINKDIKLKSIDFKSNTLINLPLLDTDNVNSCIEYFIKVDTISGDNYKSRAMLDLIISILHEPCFNQLRTKEQLGYVVFSSLRKSRNYFGYRILIQSEKSCKFLITRIESFLDKMIDHLHDLDDEVFERFKLALIDKKLIKLKNLSEEATKFWTAITEGYFDFHINDKLIDVLKTLTKNEISSFYKSMLKNPKLIFCLNSSQSRFIVLKKYIDDKLESETIENLSDLIETHQLDIAKLADVITVKLSQTNEFKMKLIDDLTNEIDVNFPVTSYPELTIAEFRNNDYCDMPHPVEPLTNFYFNDSHL